MKIKETVGLDVSKLTLDVLIHTTQDYARFENSKSGLKKLTRWVFRLSKFKKEEIFFLLEHTGRYALEAVNYFSESNINFDRIPAIVIKKSMGIIRSKSDKIDAKTIAHFAYRIKDEIKKSGTFNNRIQEIHSLVGLKDDLTKKRAGLKASLTGNKSIPLLKTNKSLINIPKRLIKILDKEIKLLQKEIMSKIKADEELFEIYNLITSVKGIGQETAIRVIIYTEGFTKFPTWRKFASFCGIAPFPNQSGTSLRGKTKVSHYAHKKLKSLFHMCARSAIEHNPEMRQYYNQRIAKGKHPMSTINIVRNKLMARMFAAVERRSPYVDIYKYAS